MNQLLNAIQSGFTSKNIIDYLKKKFPKHVEKINTAIAMGFTPDQIIKFLSGGRQAVNIEERNEPLTEHQAIVQRERQRTQNINQGALGLALAGGSALGAYALGRALPTAVQQLAPSLLGGAPVPPGQQQPNPVTPITPIQSQSNQTVIQNPQPTIAPGAQVSLSIPQPAINSLQNHPKPTIAPGAQVSLSIPQPAINSLQNHPIKQKVDQLISSKNTPEAISTYLRQFNKKEVKELEKATGKSIEEILNDYYQTIPISLKNPPSNEILREMKNPRFSGNVLGTKESINIENPPISAQIPQIQIEKPKEKEIEPIQGKTVILPNGDIGQVKNERQGIAEIDVDGKTKTRKLDEVIESPIAEKDLADLYNDLIGGIEKKTGQEVSRNVYWAGYDPKTNELAYVPHNGALYIYENISPEDAAQLTNILAQRKSTGENYIGAWNAGTKSPIGSEMFKLIQRLQKERGGKGKEYSNKFEKIYDALEPATKAAKEKHKEQKKEQVKKVMGIMEEPKPKKTIKEKVSEKTTIQKLDDELGKYFDKLMALDEKITRENRDKDKKINVEKRAKDIKKFQKLQKKVDQLRDMIDEETKKNIGKK